MAPGFPGWKMKPKTCSSKKGSIRSCSSTLSYFEIQAKHMANTYKSTYMVPGSQPIKWARGGSWLPCLQILLRADWSCGVCIICVILSYFALPFSEFSLVLVPVFWVLSVQCRCTTCILTSPRLKRKPLDIMWARPHDFSMCSNPEHEPGIQLILEGMIVRLTELGLMPKLTVQKLLAL